MDNDSDEQSAMVFTLLVEYMHTFPVDPSAVFRINLLISTLNSSPYNPFSHNKLYANLNLFIKIQYRYMHQDYIKYKRVKKMNSLNMDRSVLLHSK